MEKSKNVALDKVKINLHDVDFLTSKINTANFYNNNILCRSTMHFSIVKNSENLIPKILEKHV